jgi:hypothetical protein
MKRIFISQPMADKNEMQIQLERDSAEEFLAGLFGNEIEVVNPIGDAPSGPRSPLVGLAKGLELMASADLVYFCAGWKKARGCKIEHEAATKYGLCVMYQPG